MPNLSEAKADLKPSVAAAIGILARKVLSSEAGLPSVARILSLTGSSKAQAYEMLARLQRACRELHRRPGRSPQPARRHVVEQTIARVRDFAMEHPGAVSGKGPRRTYSVPFRRFVLDLLGPSGPAHELTVDQAAAATGVPLGTLKDWLATPAPSLDPPQTGEQRGRDDRDPAVSNTSTPNPDPPPSPPIDDVTVLAGSLAAATVLVEWTRWTGNFTTFCDHVRDHLRLRYGRTFISALLEAAGLRIRTRRRQTRPTWNRDTFRRLFPGAQWLGDGTTLAIQLNGDWFAFNLQAALDVASNAMIGIHVSDVENEQAVVAAFENAENTTGERPVFMTLDGKPCNHTPGVEQGIKPSRLLAATPGRGQAKAPLEGQFGLFAQTAPPLKVAGRSRRELARSILHLVLLVWAWTRNGRPRTRLWGLTPSQYYRQAAPTPEEIENAKRWAAELERRQQRTRQTRRRRADPARLQILTETLDRNDIEDPRGRLAVDLARYGIDAILHGIAIFESKRANDTIPADADPGRYLAGIIRNRNDADEIEQTGQRLLELRLRHRDLSLQHLEARRDWLLQTSPPADRPTSFVDQALDAHRLIDFRFFAHEAASALARLSAATAQAQYPYLLRRVAAAFKTDPERRQFLVGRLARAVAERVA